RPLSAVSIPILVPDDGELRALCDPIRHIVGPMMGDSQCKDEAIQRASHIVNHITEDQRKRLKGDWVSACLQHDILRVVWVDFKPGATVLSLTKPVIGCVIQIEQMMCRSPVFQDVAVFWGGHEG